MQLIFKFLSRVTILGAFLLASASLHADIFHGTVEVIQNDASNNTSSVTLSLSGATSPGASIGAASNRGDYIIELPPGQGAAAGIMIPTVAENGRNNSSGGDPNDTFFPTSAVDVTDDVFNNGSEGYFLALSRSVPSANSTEFNVNTAFAYFPYDQFLGGLARPGTQTLVGSAGLNYGTNFTEIETGAYFLDLGPGASSQDGILLATSAINEDNFALTESFLDGTFEIYNQDNGTDAGNDPDYEEDPVGFVYLPASSAGSNGIIALGRINSDGTSEISGGTFTVTRTGTGTYLLTIPGHTNETGTLIVTGAGGENFNIDNAISYEWAPQQNGWVIQSRDLPNYTLQDPTGISSVEAFFSFAFLSGLVVVDTLEDELDPVATDGTGTSLREAIRDSEGRAIVFASELSGGTITLDRGQLVIPSGQNISINAGATGLTIDADQQSRVMEIELNATVALHGLTLTGGNATGSSFSARSGGAIFSDNATLSLSNCTLSGNSAASNGGGIFSEGFLSGNATLSLSNCTLSGNSANSGGGIFSNGSEGSATLSLSNCTLSGNSATNLGGGIFSNALNGSAILNLSNTILAGNTAPTGPDLNDNTNATTITVSGNNLLSSTEGNPLTNSSSGITVIAATDLNLAPLGDFGGPTQTRHPLAGSSAILSGANVTRSDQRNFELTGPPTIGAVQLGNITTIANQGALRNALTNSANSEGQVIRFASSLNGGTLILSGSQLLVPGTANGLFIDASSLANGLTINANQQSRVMKIESGATAALHGLTLTGGRTNDGNNGSNNIDGDDGSSGDDGGGIFTGANSSLTLFACTITGNQTGSGGNGGNTITNNFGSGGDGGGGGSGGGIFAGVNSSLALSACTITGNQTGNGGDGGDGAFGFGFGDGGNGNNGGDGGGIFASSNSSLTLSACTITENQTGNGGDGGDGDNLDGLSGFGGFGGGLSFSSSATLTSNHSIIAGNSGRDGSEQIFGTIDAGTENLTSGDPLLAPLGHYGGPTMTMPPLPGSPAIDAADSNNPGGTDQRGFPRFSGNALDIGSVELQGTTDPTLQLDSDSDGSSNGVELAIGTNPLVADSSDERNLRVIIAPDGSPQLTLGLVNAQQANIILRLTRSTDLITFEQIMSNESMNFQDPGDGLLMLNDPSPPEGRAFYRLEAELRP